MTMMTLEDRVQEMLHSRLEHYRQMNLLADQMLDDNDLSSQWHEAAERLNRICLSVEKEDRSNQALADDLRDGKFAACEAIVELKQRLASQMQSFLMKVSRLEQTAMKSKQELLPKIQAGVRAVQMKNAYGKYS